LWEWECLGLYFKVAKGEEGREEDYRQGDTNMDATVGERDDLILSNGREEYNNWHHEHCYECTINIS
jgi:hypothetical protein